MNKEQQSRRRFIRNYCSQRLGEETEMKSVLISIQPKWVEKIANGEKTIEVRKTRPKLETLFKCYIYMSQGDMKDLGLYSEWIYKNRMKVAGEFICDRIEIFEKSELGIKSKDFFALAESCVKVKEMREYIGENKIAYGWHISDLKIYDKPKELIEFCIPCKTNCEDCEKPIFYDCWKEKVKIKVVTRPPQSWQYVEEI